MDKNQSHKQNSENSNVLHSKDTKSLRIKTKIIEKIMSFSTYRKGLTFLSLIRFTSGRHAAKLSLLYALSAC